MELINIEAGGGPAFKLIDNTPIAASDVPPLSYFTTIRIRFLDDFVGVFFASRKEDSTKSTMPIELAIFCPATDNIFCPATDNWSVKALKLVWSLFDEKISAINSVGDRIANKNPVFYDLGPYFDTMSTVDFLCQASSLRRINGIVGLEHILHWLSQQQGFIKCLTMYPSAGGTQISEVDFGHFLLSFFLSRDAPPTSHNAKFKHGAVADDVKEFSISKAEHSLNLKACVDADGTTGWALKSFSAKHSALSNALVTVQACPGKIGFKNIWLIFQDFFWIYFVLFWYF